MNTSTVNRPGRTVGAVFSGNFFAQCVDTSPAWCRLIYMNAQTTNTDSIEYLDTVPHFWDDADRICLWLEAHPGLHNRSTIKRRAKVVGDVQQILGYLHRHQEVRADGNGAWRKYGAK